MHEIFGTTVSQTLLTLFGLNLLWRPLLFVCHVSPAGPILTDVQLCFCKLTIRRTMFHLKGIFLENEDLPLSYGTPVVISTTNEKEREREKKKKREGEGKRKEKRKNKKRPKSSEQALLLTIVAVPVARCTFYDLQVSPTRVVLSPFCFPQNFPEKRETLELQPQTPWSSSSGYGQHEEQRYTKYVYTKDTISVRFKLEGEGVRGREEGREVRNVVKATA